MFSVLRGARPAYTNFRIKRQTLVFCCGFSTRSVKNISKFPVEKFRVLRYDIPAKIRIQNREFHTTKRRDIPPIFAILLRPVLRIGAFLFGRTIRKWWLKKDASERERYTAWFRKRRSYFFGIFGAISSMVLIFYLTHIENTPITNRPRFIMFTNKQQATFAKLMFEMQLEQYKDHIVPKTDPMYRPLTELTNYLLNQNNDLDFVKEKQWTVTIVDLPAIRNAFVLPGGNIFIFTGILDVVENSDQLSFVLAHEIAHALLNHSIEQVSNGFLVDLLLALPLISIWVLFPDLVAAVFQFAGQVLFNIFHDLPYSRALEQEADEVGLTLAAKACVDVREAVVFWGLMRSLEELESQPEDIDMPWLSTHPNHKDREKMLDEQMSRAIALRSNKCPVLSPIDPRKRFYERSAKDIEAQFKTRGLI